MSSHLPSRYPTKMLYKFLMYIMRATCHANLILLGFVTLMIFGEEYK